MQDHSFPVFFFLYACFNLFDNLLDLLNLLMGPIWLLQVPSNCDLPCLPLLPYPMNFYCYMWDILYLCCFPVVGHPCVIFPCHFPLCCTPKTCTCCSKLVHKFKKDPAIKIINVLYSSYLKAIKYTMAHYKINLKVIN